jgi:hypothetical protein
MLRISIFLIFIISSFLFSYEFVSEAPIELENNVKKSTIIHLQLEANSAMRQSGDAKLNDFNALLKTDEKLQAIFSNYMQMEKISPDNVHMERTFNNLDKIRNKNNAAVITELERTYTIRFDHPVAFEELSYELAKLASVRYSHGPVVFQVLDDNEKSGSFPNDPLYQNDTQWELSTTQGVNAEGAFDYFRNDASAIIGLFEPEGYPNSSLIELNGIVTNQGSGVYADHATYTASAAGAKTNNNHQMASINTNATIYAYSWNDHNDFYNRIVESIADGCKVLSMSFHTVEVLPLCIPSPIKENSADKTQHYYRPKSFSTISNAIDLATSSGLIVVAAAGNAKSPVGEYEPCYDIPTKFYPAAYANVIGVSASDVNGEFAENQTYGPYNYGSHVDINAPGVMVTALKNNSQTDLVSGTSFSTPFTAGLIARMLTYSSNSSPAHILDVFKQTSDEIGEFSYDGNGYNTHFGYGRINVYEALNYYASGNPWHPHTFKIAQHSSNGVYYPKLTWIRRPEPDLKGYEIWRRKAGQSYQKIATTSWDATSYVDTGVGALPSGPNYKTVYYKIRAIDYDNQVSGFTYELRYQYFLDFNKSGKLAENSTLGEDEAIEKTAMLSVGPNPFNPTTTIRYQLADAAPVQIRIFNALGQQVYDAGQQRKSAGVHSFRFDASHLSSGVYFFILNSPTVTLKQKLILMK